MTAAKLSGGEGRHQGARPESEAAITTVEIRGRGDKWKVFYPNAERLAIPVQVFDREGIYKETLMCGGDTTGMTEAHFEGTKEEAIAYAEYLVPGCEIKFNRVKTQAEVLEVARQAKQEKTK